ncbi:hypothetical protein [Pseudonocardia sp. TRM90224]|uniref:hypothetical protein n=1 Tax=Pseudonocardia sp. TRM90224 TaxID=2812678 RepID=UPI001E5DE4DC|nr:hypothetical protein [Pseudonocardia sp. TRM90224]
MSAPTDQFTETVTRAQEAVTAAVRTWTDTVLSSLSGVQALPDATAVVDRYFEIAQQVLDTQREFAHSVLAAGVLKADATPASKEG